MKRKIIIGVLLTFIFLSCKKENKTYTGEPFVEFSTSTINQLIPFTTKSDVIISIKVQLDTKSMNVDKTLQIEETGSNNSAIKNTQYIVKNYKTILHADSIFAIFTVLIKSQNFKDGESASVLFKISDSSELKPADNYKICQLNITKQSLINVFIGKDSCYEPSNQAKYLTTFVPGSTVNTIKNLNFWDFAADGQPVIYTIYPDTSMKVEIVSQDWVDKSGIEYTVSGIGKYDYFGNMTVNYSITKENESTPYEVGVHYFTHLK
jgi:hypothetical protein